MPISTDGVALYQHSSGSNGAYLNSPSNQRLRFDIGDYINERFYFGAKFFNRLTTPTERTDMYIRITNSAGTVVYGPQAYATAGNGYISTYAEAVAGPNVGGANPSGYSSLTFSPNANGDYYIETYASNDNGVTQNFDYLVGSISILLLELLVE